MLEDWLGRIYKNAPKLTPNARLSVVNLWPWIAVIFGVVQLSAAEILWQWGRNIDSLATTSGLYGSALVLHDHLNVFYWLSLAVLLIDGIVLLMAFPGLRQLSRIGWRLIFYGALLDFIYGVLSAFNNYGSIGSLLLQLVVTAIVLYFLYQVRGYYKAPKA